MLQGSSFYIASVKDFKITLRNIRMSRMVLKKKRAPILGVGRKCTIYKRQLRNEGVNMGDGCHRFASCASKHFPISKWSQKYISAITFQLLKLYNFRLESIWFQVSFT